MRRLVERFLSLVLRIFFEKVERVGDEKVPPDGPLLFVLNHPNGLIDPLFVLCLGPRRVSFLAKEPLFRMPVVGTLVRALECLPVYRAQDGADTSANRATMAAARRFLAEGKAIALFPEGTSHSDPDLKPLKTGAARLALASNADEAVAGRLRIVPAGIFYSAKQTFRSRASLVFGDPLDVPVVPLNEALEPPRESARELTDRIAASLAALTLRAETARALLLSEAAEEVFAAAAKAEASDDARQSLAVFEQMELRNRLAGGYAHLSSTCPDEVEAVVRRLEGYRELRARHGLAPDHPALLAPGPVLAYASRSLLALALLAPLALPGLVVHYPAYRLIGFLSRRMRSVTDDIVATAKVLGAMLFFPASWLLVAAIFTARFGLAWGALALAVAPVSGMAALVFAERAGALWRGARALALYLRHPDRHDFLVAERRGIRADIERLARALEES